MTVAVESFFVLQVMAYWLAFGLFVHASLERRAPVLASLGALAGFLPPLFNFAVVVESNVHAGVSFILALAMAYALPGRRSILASAVLVYYGFISRSGMIVVVGPLLFACLLLNRPAIGRRRAAVYAAAGSAAFFLVSAAITTLFLGAPTREQVISVSQVFDIAGVYQKTHTHCVPPSMVPKETTAEAILAEYDPRLVSSVVWGRGFTLPETSSEFRDLRACWMNTIRQHPREYLEVKKRFALMFLMVGVDSAPFTVPDYTHNARLGLSTPRNAVTTAVADYVEKSRQMYFWKGWVWIGLGGIVSVTALALKLPQAPAIAAIYLAVLCSFSPHFLLGQAVLSRYFFISYSLSVAAVLVFINSLRDAVRARRAA